jgi:ABC-type antimicrobial peptide transport system permease subunit
VALLLAAFAVLALAVAAVGAYAVSASGVAQRLREIGIRVALGATASDIRRTVLGGALARTALGLAFGAVGALAVSRLLSTFLPGAGRLDPATFAGVAAILAACSLGAAWLPARRASRVDPLVALRHD